MGSESENQSFIAYIIEKNGEVIEASDMFYQLTKFSSRHIIGKPFAHVWKGLLRIHIDFNQIAAPIETFLFTESLDVRFIVINIQKIDVYQTKYLIHEIPGSRFEEKNAYLEQLRKTNLVGIAVYSVPDMVLLRTNQKYLDFLEKPFHQASMSMGRKIQDIITGWKGSPAEKFWRQAIETKEVVQVKEYKHTGYNKGVTFWDSIILPVLEDGTVKYVVSNTTEVTERVMQRIKLQEQSDTIKKKNRQMEAIIESLDSHLGLFDAKGNILKKSKISKETFSTVGNVYDHLNSKTLFYDLEDNLIPIENASAFRVLKGEKFKDHKMKMVHGDMERYVSITGIPIFNDDNELEMCVTVTHDLTELMQKEQLLKQQNEELETILHHMSDCLFIIGKDGKFTRTNKAADELISKTPASTLLDKRPGETLMHNQKYYDEHGQVLPIEKLPAYRVLMGEKIESQIVIYRNNNKETILEFSATPVFDDSGRFKCGILLAHDITEIIEKKRQVKQQNENLAAIIDNIHDGIYVFDRENHIILSNDAAQEIFGNLNKIGDAYRNYGFYTEDGTPMPYDEIPLSYVKRGVKFKNKSFIFQRAGKKKYISVSGAPVFDSNGAFQKGILSCRDATENMESYLKIKEQQEQLLQWEREKNEALENAMKLKDEFLYLITHEFRTPMAVVNSALQAIDLIYKKEVTPHIAKYLNTIRQNTNRQLRLVNNLLDITRISSGNIKLNCSNFDVVYLTRSIVKSVDVYAKQKGVNISFKSSVIKKITFLDEEKYERILLNLLANALKFTPKGHGIFVYVFTKRRKGQNMIHIEVKDEGIGIPRDRQHVIFERFGQVDSSLSRRAEGTGLGLHLVKLLIDAFHGEIILESELNQGSTFTVILPIIKSDFKEETAATSDMESHFLNHDNRIIQAAAVEFSDIYL